MNTNTRSRNTINNSITGIMLQLTSAVLAFAYRTILINVLGVEYLGINGLFSNILSLLSLTELGFNIAIVYRMYDPVNKNDQKRIAALMSFFETIYKCVFGIIIILGLLVLPFLKLLIKEANEIPDDVNLYTVYLVMLIQSASTYLFTSRQMLLQASQKDYFNNIFQIISNIVKYGVQIAILILLKDYFLLLLCGIIAGIILNIVYYYIISYKFRDIFKHREKITKEEKVAIFDETKALLMHKIGGVVLSSTDNLVISSCIGLTIVGIYSNYVVITSMVSMVIIKLFGGATASIGNLKISESKEKLHSTYLSLNLMVFWAVSICSVCLFSLLNPFISLWFGERYVLNIMETWSIIVAFYIMYSRYINGTFINACGIYSYDRYRPLVEAAVNLVISVALAKMIGLSGVFVGTIISELVTSWWREPYLLYKHVFTDMKAKAYWIMTISVGVLTVVMEWLCFCLCKFVPVTWTGIILKLMICLLVPNIALYLIFRKRKEFEIIKNLLDKIKGVIAKGKENEDTI